MGWTLQYEVKQNQPHKVMMYKIVVRYIVYHKKNDTSIKK